MKAYGRQIGDELEYRDLGAPSKHRKTRSRVRWRGRRILKRQAREDTKREIRESAGLHSIGR